MLTHWIWFAGMPGLTERQKAGLLARGLDPEDLYCGDLDQMLSDVPAGERDCLRNRDLTGAEEVLRLCAREDVEVLTMADPGYPRRLKGIADPPIVLYYKGKLPDFDHLPTVGVVGTRKASVYGMNTAHRLGYEIARCGGLVVSGMAMGIDGMAMRGALEAAKPTVAVLGCGPEQAYPRANRAVYADTLRDGCVLSEYAPGTPPYKWNFPRRNRIISGLSCGVLVVEAPKGSGSLITARQALEQGRDIFVVPGNVDMPGFEGSYQLLKDGATPVRNGWDVMSEYRSWFPDTVHRDEAAAPSEPRILPEKPQSKVAQKAASPGQKQDYPAKSDKKAIDKGAASPYIDLNTILEKLTAEEAAVVTALKNGERLVDDVIAETGFSTGKMLGLLTMMEIKGLVQRLPGKRIRIK